MRDSYDNCIADLDEQLGRLLDELERLGILDRTWLVITSDHGESFGEQAGVFRHGNALYQPQLHVPLLFVPPAGRAAGTGREPARKPPRRAGDHRRRAESRERVAIPRRIAGPVLGSRIPRGPSPSSRPLGAGALQKSFRPMSSMPTRHTC